MTEPEEKVKELLSSIPNSLIYECLQITFSTLSNDDVKKLIKEKIEDHMNNSGFKYEECSNKSVGDII